MQAHIPVTGAGGQTFEHQVAEIVGNFHGVMDVVLFEDQGFDPGFRASAGVERFVTQQAVEAHQANVPRTGA
ncbi:MAG: hypothetical protein ACLFQT_07740 [Thiohalophilus sp.]